MLAEPGDILEFPAQVKHRVASNTVYIMQTATDAPYSLEELVDGSQAWENLADAASKAGM